MSSPTSPYKEVGLLGQSVSSVNRQKKPAKAGLIVGDHTRGIPRMGHKFPVGMLARGKYQTSTPDICVKCGNPRFAVENKKCRGKRVSKTSR